MLRIIVTKFPKSKIPERHRVPALKFHKSSRQNAKDKPDFCPPEPAKSPRTGLVYTIGALALVGGATLGYAKYDEDFRKWLKEQAPFTDTIIKIVFQEDGAFGDSKGFLNSLREFFISMFQSEEEVKIKKREVISERTSKYSPPKPAFGPLAKNSKEPEECYTEIRLETKPTEAGAEPSVEIAGIPKEAGKEITATNPKSVAELELRIGETATQAVQGYARAVVALKKYNQEIEHFLEESVENVDQSVWEALKKLTMEKEQTMREADKVAKEVNKKLAQLKTVINSPELQAPQDVKVQSLHNIDRIKSDVDKAKKELDDEKAKANIADKYWKKVEEGRRHFADEIEILFPNANLRSKQLNIEEGDLDLFTLHAVSKVLYYQKEVAKIETIAAERLKKVVDNAKKDGAEILSHEQICQELEKQKRLLEEEYGKKCLRMRLETARDLKNQLKLQSEAFHDHLEDAIKTREMEIEQKFGRSFDEKLMEERCKFKEQVAAMVGRLKGMDKALKERNDADKTAQQGQVLWSACQALYRSIKSGCPGLPLQDQLRPLAPEINAVVKAAADGDELVKVVIEGIPKEAKDRGVYPEDALRERFIKVEQVARKLALVPEEGARLHMFLLSYLQSLLLLKAPNPIPQAELNDEKVDFSKLSTNEILQRARYYLDRGDFAQTLRYMNLLKGASRAIARQWMEETRILLETQQAANTLMAHASASGLMYL